MIPRAGYCRIYWGEDGREPQPRREPQNSPEHRPIPGDELSVYNAVKQVRQLREINPDTGHVSVDGRSVVVSIDGACRGNGKSLARASWGVYFGPQSMHNECGLLDATLRQTSTRAEIEALSQALYIIRKYVSEDYSLLHYHIRTDSSYLVDTFQTWIHNWIKKGGKTSRGRTPLHFDTLMNIHEHLEEMAHRNMSFNFWHVPREENKEADALANYALDQASEAYERLEDANPESFPSL